jgi:sensor histidine kinase YesM
LETLHFNYTNGFPGERLITIFFEKNGDLYCRSSAGLYHFIRNGDHNYTFDAYTVADGLPANEIHALCRDSKGNFWVGTHEGITFFHPGPEISHLPPPNAFIEKISVNGETKNYSNNLISLGAQENAVSFKYYATSYRNNSRLLYSYLLEGFDKDWSPYSSQNTVNYKNLPSGNYRFMVKAKNFLGIESVKKSTVLFSIATPFYRTGWFYLLLATGLLLLIVILYRYRISQVRHEEKIKSQFVQQLSQLEVKALRSQMNPHFIFNSLNAINRYILKNEKTEASAYLTKFAKLIRLILDHSRLPRVPLSQELAALELYLQLESLRFQNNFEYAVSVENELSPQSIFIPPMIIQPIVENAIWHGLLPKGSNCSLKIDFRSNGSNLICTIEDNGIGRSKAEEIQQQQMLRKSSVGMSTTIQRLKLLTEEKQEDASITVEDLYDKFGNAAGTKVKILIPFTYK